VWVPKSATEVEDAAARGDLEETHTFDAKAALPGPRKNHHLAIDVCAMSVAGGSLLYGLGEDKSKRLTKLSPIELAGASERVSQIVDTSIAEPPFIRVVALHTEADPAKGYLLVVVPQSARAPHQVTTGDEMRFYGRGAKGNRILSENEVAALYGRRERREADREKLLDSELERMPEPDPSLGYLVAYARPVVPDDSMVEQVAPEGQQLVEVLIRGAKSWGHVKADRHGRGRSYDPDLRHATTAWRRGAEGWTLSTFSGEDNRPGRTAKIDLDFDGTGHFFCGRVADTNRDQLFLFDGILAGNLASFFAAMGALYEAAGYVGYVDVGFAVTGIEGSIPYSPEQIWRENSFSGPSPKRTARVSAAELRDDVTTVTLSLIRRLLDVTRGSAYMPFEADPAPSE
jgi:hypothetical protein